MFCLGKLLFCASVVHVYLVVPVQLSLIFVATTTTTTTSAFVCNGFSSSSKSRRQRHILENDALQRVEEEEEHHPKLQKLRSGFVPGPTLDTKPDYDNIHGLLGKWADKLFMSVFRRQLAKEVGFDSKLANTNYMGIVELALAMNSRFEQRQEIQKRSQTVLRKLFPSWMPPAYAVLFSKPFPKFSARMNAWATMVAGTWLMGKCELFDVEIDNGEIGKRQGLKVERCRFLEESRCASVCINSCKIPTQKFFLEEMQLPLTMTPDYETFECEFAFGKTPNAEELQIAKDTPCLQGCPSAGQLRIWHTNNAVATANTTVVAAASASATATAMSRRCNYIDEKLEYE